MEGHPAELTPGYCLEQSQAIFRLVVKRLMDDVVDVDGQ